ncbi:MAG: trigger factor [Dehalococcoidia bacterium]
MKVSTEKLENSQIVLQVEMEPEDMERALEQAYRRLVKRAVVPGFRKGKVPRDMLERYLGREAFLQEAIEHSVSEAYNKALEENDIQAIAPPQIEVIQREPVMFKATVAVRPTVELGDYRQVRLDPEEVKVGEEEVQAALEQLPALYAPWEPVERPVQRDDLVTVDVEGTLNGRSILSQKGVQIQVSPEVSFPVPGFAQELEGVAKGEEREFTLAFPPDHPAQELRGNEYFFRVGVGEVKEKRLAPLDDEFAKGLDFADLDALRQQVASDLRARAEAEARRRLEAGVMEAVADISQVDFPPLLVERELERLMKDQERNRLSNLEKTEDELRQELHPQAQRRVIYSLILGRVAEEEKIEVGEEEVGAEEERMVQEAGERGGEVRRFLASPAARDSLKELLLTRKTVDRLVSIVTQGEEGAGNKSPGRKEEE